MFLDRPTWAKWSQFDTVKLWQAVALSRNVDPDSPEIFAGVQANTMRWRSHEDPPGHHEFKNRLEISESNLGGVLPVVVKVETGGRSYMSEVRIADFVKFAVQKGWKFPAEFAGEKIIYKLGTNVFEGAIIGGNRMVRTPGDGYIPEEQWREMFTQHHEPIPPEVAIAASIKEAVASNVSVVRLVPTSKPKPDWEYWVSIPDTTIINAVALSCDVEPNVFANEFIGVGADPSSEMHQFWKRTLVASANAVNGALKRVRSNPGTTHLPPCIFDDVNLIEFAAWVVALRSPWELPKEFPIDPVDWGRWGRTDAAKLWQAVLLSLGRSPDVTFEEMEDSFRTPYDSVRSVAVSSLGRGLRIHRRPDPDDLLGMFSAEERAEVLLSEFRDWAEGKGYTLPDRFPKMKKPERPTMEEKAPTSPTPVVYQKTPSDDLELGKNPRETLLTIIAGAIGDSIENPSTAAKTIERRFEKWGIDSPKHRQILNWLNEAKRILSERRAKD